MEKERSNLKLNSPMPHPLDTINSNSQDMEDVDIKYKYQNDDGEPVERTLKVSEILDLRAKQLRKLGKWHAKHFMKSGGGWIKKRYTCGSGGTFGAVECQQAGKHLSERPLSF